MTDVESPVAAFKRQLAGWLSIRDLGEIDKIWRERSEWHDGLPDWVGAVLYVEEGQLGRVLNAWRNDWVELQNEFEQLMQKYDVWWEMENSCVVWIYDPNLLEDF